MAAACLGHDIGNPPFGHSGEQALRYWWSNLQQQPSTNLIIGDCMNQFIANGYSKDFENFEGNATGLRRLKSLGLTAATIATYTKYPGTANHVDQKLLKKMAFT